MWTIQVNGLLVANATMKLREGDRRGKRKRDIEIDRERER